MALGMHHSVPESVENNGGSVPVDHHEVVNHRSSANGSPQRSNSVDSLKVETPTRKGFGLKKWRRIKRDGPVKDEATTTTTTTPAGDDGSKLLKRGLTGLANPPLKHVDLSSVEARQSSEGSVGSVNMAVHHHLQGLAANGFSTGPGFMFNVGQGFEKSEEELSGNSIATKNVGGEKIVSGSQGKIWRDTIKNASQKPCSSMDSDLRSSDFVFSSGAVSAAKNHGENDERKEVQTYSRSENGEQDEDKESKKNNNYWADKDQIADSIKHLAALHDALWKELKNFQELGKETCREEKSTSSGSQALILKQKVKHLQHKLEDARADLDAKEARIQELEYSKIESELEVIFQRKIEAEIHHLVLTRSLSSSLQVLKEQPNKVHSLAEDSEPNRGNMLGKACKSSFYFLTQLILLVFILRLLLLQGSPASRLVIPT
ncbi:WPP domain-interacting protein 3 [Raphanus sativus]|nr:WPP domain-interacting protein 3 [Raphanus sativus]KAJ4871343.1 WPP domain-interacting protein 3 [Raphanus sativus]